MWKRKTILFLLKERKTLGVDHLGVGGVVRKKKEISSISEEWWVKSLTEDF